MTLLTKEQANIIKINYNHFYEGLKLRLEDAYKKEYSDLILVSVLLVLENKLNIKKAHFTSMHADKVFDLFKENLYLVEEYEKKYLT